MNFIKNIKNTVESWVSKQRQPTQNLYFVIEPDRKGFRFKGFKDFEFSDKLLSPQEYFKEFEGKYDVDLKAPIQHKSGVYSFENLKGFSTAQRPINSYWIPKDYSFFYYLYDTHTALQNPINFATTEIKGLNHCFVDMNDNPLKGLKEYISTEYGFSIEDWASKVTKNLMITGIAVDTCFLSNTLYSTERVSYKLLPSYQLSNFYVNFDGAEDESIVRFDWCSLNHAVTTTYDLYKDRLLDKRPFYTVALDNLDVLPDSRLNAFKNPLGLIYNHILRQSHIYHNGGSSSSLTLISDLLTAGSETMDGRNIMFEQIQEAIRGVKNIEQTGQKLVIPVNSNNLNKVVAPGQTQTYSMNDLISNVDIGGKSLLERPVDTNFMRELKRDAWTVFSFSPDTYGEGRAGLSSGYQVDVANKTNSKHVLALLKNPVLKLGNNFRFKYILEDLEKRGYFKRKFETNEYVFREGEIERPYTAKDIKYDIKANVLSPSTEMMKIGLEANKNGLINNKKTLVKYFGFEEGEISDDDERQDILDNAETTNKDVEEVGTKEIVTNKFLFKIKPQKETESIVLESEKSLPKLNSNDIQLLATSFFNKKNKSSLRRNSRAIAELYKSLLKRHKEILESKGNNPDKPHDFSKIGSLMATSLYRQNRNIIFEALESQYLSVNLKPIIKKFRVRKKAKLENLKALDKDLMEKIDKVILIPTLSTFLDPEILFKIMDTYARMGKMDISSQMEEEIDREMTDLESERINKILATWVKSRVENHFIGSPEGETIPKEEDKRLEDLYYSKDSLEALTRRHIISEIAKVLENNEGTDEQIEEEIRQGLSIKAENRVDGILSGVILGSFTLGAIVSANVVNPMTKTWLRTITPFPRERGGIKFKEEDHLSTVGKTIPYNAYFIHVKGVPTFYSQEVPYCRCGIRIGWDKKKINTVEGIDYFFK